MNSGIGGSNRESELAAIEPGKYAWMPIDIDERMLRLDNARRLMAQSGIDAMLIGAGSSMRYFSGLPWTATERLVAMLLMPTGKPLVICPMFELGSLRAGLAIDAEIRTWEEHEDPCTRVAEILSEAGARTAGIDPQLPFAVAEGVRRALGTVDIVEATAVIDGCRMCKSPAELGLIRQAMALTLEVHRRAAAILNPGISATEVKRFIDEAHRALGAQGGSTFCAVQFGKATAYPHGVPGEQRLEERDLVLIDTGCQLDGYNSDITRTYAFGRPTPRESEIWQLERKAQQAAFDAVRPGLTCESVDHAARQVIEHAGLGPDYNLPGLPHRTGHGIGLSIHEPAYLVRGDKTPLRPGMCFSNEPMIVLPEQFGIRLEDHFHVTEHGAQWFTQPSVAIDAPFG
jgi:Xaa-Pro dipeptidase